MAVWSCWPSSSSSWCGSLPWGRFTIRTTKTVCNFRRHYHVACPSAPKGAVDDRRFAASLKRCPDTKRNFFRSVLALVGLLCCLILLIAAWLTAQQGPPTATIGPAPAQIAPPRPNYPFPDGRSYVYSAEWHLITAGTGVVRMDTAGNERKVTATAESSGAVNVIFPGARPLRIALRSADVLLALHLQAQRGRLAQTRDFDPLRLRAQEKHAR